MALDNSDNQKEEAVERVSGDNNLGSNSLRLESFSLLQQPYSAPRPEATVCIPTLQVNDARLNMCNEYSVNSPIAQLHERNRDSVVKINTLDAATRNEGLGSTGTGFFVNSEGLIATGYHVVRDAVEIRIKTADGKQYTATVKQVDVAKDQALLQINPTASNERFRPVELATSSSDIGRTTQLVAMGYPNNQNLLHLSEARFQRRQPLRNIPINGGFFEGEDRNREVISTRAHVNHGNSGGPVFDAATGRVVGMVNLSNQVDTHINPVEDLHQFIASIQNPNRDTLYANNGTNPVRIGTSTENLTGALFNDGRATLAGQLGSLRLGQPTYMPVPMTNVTAVSRDMPRVPMVNPNPYTPTGLPFGRGNVGARPGISTSPLLEEFKRK